MLSRLCTQRRGNVNRPVGLLVSYILVYIYFSCILSEVQAHSEKLYFVRCHPLVSDLLVSSSYDMTVKFWDWHSKTALRVVTNFPDEIFCCCFSFVDPTTLLTISKDKKLRRMRAAPGLPEMTAEDATIASAEIDIGQRGARCFLACQDKLIVVSAFTRQSHRQLVVYDADSLESLTGESGTKVGRMLLRDELVRLLPEWNGLRF